MELQYANVVSHDIWCFSWYVFTVDDIYDIKLESLQLYILNYFDLIEILYKNVSNKYIIHIFQNYIPIKMKM